MRRHRYNKLDNLRKGVRNSPSYLTPSEYQLLAMRPHILSDASNPNGEHIFGTVAQDIGKSLSHVTLAPLHHADQPAHLNGCLEDAHRVSAGVRSEGLP